MESNLKKVVAYIGMVVMISSCTTLNKNNQNQSNSANKADDKSPSLTSPKVRKVWVPEKIEGDRFIEGHWMWVLERTTTWSQ